MLRLLLICGWLACVIYSTIPTFWLLIHRHTDYWRAQTRSPYRVLLPLWMILWLVVGTITAPWRHRVFYHNGWMWLPAAFLFGLGFWLYRKSGAQFSVKQLSGLPELEAGHVQRLVTSGIRSRLRHPVYLAHLCEMLAWSMGTGLAVCFGLSAMAMITGIVMIRAEDEELERRFGEPFLAYRKSVPALLPRLGHFRVRL